MLKIKAKRSLVLSLFIAAVFILASTGLEAEDFPKDIPDGKITQAAEVELAVAESVSSHLIDVNTEDGIVTLKGSVDNLYSKKRSEELVMKIKGVRSVVNAIEVRPTPKSDEDIKEDISNAMLWDNVVEDFEINTKVKNGIVELNGEVESWTEKKLAEDIAMTVTGVRGIDNNIEINIRDERPDDEIKNDIRRRLSMDPRIYEGAIEVYVDDGEVRLEGAVGSSSEKRLAYVDAWVSGVHNVNNDNLEVKWWAQDEYIRDSKISEVSDEKISDAVEEAITYDPRLLGFNIDIRTEDGIVWLSGNVNSMRAKLAAEKDAKNTIGVLMVNNNIKVRPAELYSDTFIADRIRQVLSWNPFVERHEIEVSVRNNKVYLDGDVDSQFERRQAELAVSGVGGVVEIDNNLEIEGEPAMSNDEKIEENIESELYWSFLVESDEIDVHVDDGVAEINGEVDSWQEYNAAIENAFEGGAKMVDANLKVNGEDMDRPDYNYYEYYKWTY